MAWRLGTNARNNAITASVRGAVSQAAQGLDSGTIQIRSGAQPTNVSDAAQGTLLATVTFPATSFGAASAGTATAGAITSDTNAAASGTAGHARLLTSAAASHSDCTCGQGSGDISFDNSSIVAGGTVAISSLTATQPIS